MGEPTVTSLARRRLRNGTVTLLLLAALAATVYLRQLTLHDTSYLTGWLLIAAFLVLAGYNLRKKLPFLPLASSASWLQLHLYLGLASAVLFLLHTGWTWPGGTFEITLWTLTVGLFVTGLLGLALSRLTPSAITWHGERVIFERIPRLRRQLAEEVEQLATRSVEETASGTIASYYADTLKPYFDRPRHRWYHLLRSKRPVRQLCRQIRTLERYLSEPGRRTLKDIEDAVLAKDNLDFQETWQGLLKGWLFLHIPLTYAVLVAVPLHVVLVYAFGADTP